MPVARLGRAFCLSWPVRRNLRRHVALALEVEDTIPEAYVLEVSTPGLTPRLALTKCAITWAMW